MKLTFDEIKESGNYSQQFKFDFSDIESEDALLVRIKEVDVQIDAYMLNADEAFINFDVSYDIDYLDAYDLNELQLTFGFEDDSIFTNDLQKAIDMDLEYVADGVIDLEQLIFDLIVVDIPYNYTEHKEELKPIESYEDNQALQSPFANLFDKKEE